MGKRYWIRKIAIYIIGIFGVVGLRGFGLAYLIKGEYQIGSFVRDGLGLLIIMLLFHIVYFLLNSFLKKFEFLFHAYGKYITFLIKFIFVALIVFPALLSFIQVHPQRVSLTQTPKDYGKKYEAITVENAGVSLKGWLLPNQNNKDSIILVIHGLNANKQNFLYPAILLNDLGYPVVIFDLRAHGESEGNSFTFGIKESEDINVEYEWIKTNFPNRKIYGVGYSVGASALMQATAKYNIFDKVVLDSPLLNIERTAKNKFLWVFGPLKDLTWNIGKFWLYLWTAEDFSSYDAVEYLKSCNPNKFFIIHGTADRMLPIEESIRFSESQNPKVKSWWIEGADHLQSVGNKDYGKMIKEFLDAK